MIRRIVIEMDVEESGIFNDILKMVAERTDSSVCCTLKQEIIPEKISGEIQIPSFMNSGIRTPFGKKGVMQNG